MTEEDSRESKHQLSVNTKQSVYLEVTHNLKNENVGQILSCKSKNLTLPTVAVAVAIPGHEVGKNGIFNTKTELAECVSENKREIATLLKGNKEQPYNFSKV